MQVTSLNIKYFFSCENTMAHMERVIILLDMDCFYCQVEEKLDPNLEGKPIAVVQYNAWRGGGIIAVNYPARDKGVTRNKRGEDAKKLCPDIVLKSVPEVRGKADLTKYREAGKRVANVLQKFTPLLQRASVDEAYLDVTETVLNRIKNGIEDITIDKLKNTFVVGCDTADFLHNLKNNVEFAEGNLKLCLGGIIAEQIRAEVLKQTGYKCSAGIAHNKILAKLACGLHKPNKQTILPHNAVSEYFKTVPVKKITGLGGKFGYELLEELSISKIGELTNFSEKQLVDKFGMKNGSWLYNIARGIDMEPVVTRLVSKSIGCCKRFPGKNTLVTHESIQHWMNELATEISERLEKDLEENNRRAKQMIISFAQNINKKNVSSSRTHPLNSYEQSSIAQDSLEVVRKSCQRPDGTYSVTFLGISVGQFQDKKKSVVDITHFFKRAKDKVSLEQLPDGLENETRHVNTDSGEDQESLFTENINISNDTDDEEFGNHSIYSASTEDLEEDSKSYIYFEDIYPEFVSSQPIENYCIENKVNVAVTDEVVKKRELEQRRKSSKSFFSKYFESPVERQTPGSEKTSVNDIGMVNFPETINNDNNLQISINAKTTEPHAVTKVKNLEQTKSVKRKSSDVNILQYFGKPEEPNENYCSECKKNIPIQDIFDHSDYHVAKKLQAELNKSTASSATVVSTSKLTNSIIKVKPKKATPGNIASFFKQK